MNSIHRWGTEIFVVLFDQMVEKSARQTGVKRRDLRNLPMTVLHDD